MTEPQKQVFDKVVALRHLTHSSGMITKRSQHTLLETLTDSDLAVVCQELLRHQQQFGW